MEARVTMYLVQSLNALVSQVSLDLPAMAQKKELTRVDIIPVRMGARVNILRALGLNAIVRKDSLD